jgi:hypothetical protein
VFRAVDRTYLISSEAIGCLRASPERVQDRFSSAYLAALAARTIRDVAVLRERAAKANRKLPTLTLHAEVRLASPADQNALAEELADAFAQITAKYHNERAIGSKSKPSGATGLRVRSGFSLCRWTLRRSLRT